MRYRTASTASRRSATSSPCGMRYGMRAATILRLARTMRWAIVASETRNAAAISGVVKPATARSVSATCASCARAGWQHVKIRRRRSSASGASGGAMDRSRSATFSAYRWSRRSRSMARRRAAVISHAPGLSGMPCAGHFSSAATRLSWTTSSAMSKLPMRRTIAPVSLAASSRNTAVSAASVTFLVSVRPSSFHSRPDLDRAGAPCLGHLERLVEILHLHDGESADDLFRLDERAVGDDGLAVLKTNRGRGLRSLQLFAADDLAGAAVFLKPLLRQLHAGRHLLRRHVVETLLVVHGPHKKQHVFHV